MIVRERIRCMLNARIVSEFEKYLGLPMVGGKNKMSTFKDLWEKIAKRVTGWKEKFISKAGREVLIKTIAQAIPTYSMSLFKLPRGLCNDINSIIAKYWWGQTSNENKIHWINWQRLYGPKKKGGMSFRDINAFNLALLAKQAWRLIHQQNSLFFRVYKTQYFPGVPFLEVDLGSNPSYVWRSLLQARDVILEGSAWKVGSGSLVDIATHNWLPRPPCFRREGPRPQKVRELVDVDTGQWDRAKLSFWFERHTCDDILRVPLTNTIANDVLRWKENKSNSFTVKSAYGVALRLLNPT